MNTTRASSALVLTTDNVFWVDFETEISPLRARKRLEFRPTFGPKNQIFGLTQGHAEYIKQPKERR